MHNIVKKMKFLMINSTYSVVGYLVGIDACLQGFYNNRISTITQELHDN